MKAKRSPSSGNHIFFSPLGCTSQFHETVPCSSAAQVNHLIKRVMHSSPCLHPSPISASLSLSSPLLPLSVCLFCLTGPSPVCCRAGVQVSSFAVRRPSGCIRSTLSPGPQTSVSVFFFLKATCYAKCTFLWLLNVNMSPQCV